MVLPSGIPPFFMTHSSKPAPSDFPILPVIRERWSSLAIGSKPLDENTINTLFEAARWTPSAGNGQPWRYIVATKDDGEHRERIESLIKESNGWAKNAYLLIVSFAMTKRMNPEGILVENYYGMHDTGAANGFLSLQAAEMGLAVRQFGGFDREKANEILGVPSEFMPASMIAVGYPEDDATLHEAYHPRHKAPRVRNPHETFVFKGKMN